MSGSSSRRHEGQVVTTVHTRYSHPPFPVGRSVVILVERTDPGYAELPGHPLANRGDVVLALAIAVLPVLLLLLVAHGEVQRLRARRRRQPAPEGHLPRGGRRGRPGRTSP